MFRRDRQQHVHVIGHQALQKESKVEEGQLCGAEMGRRRHAVKSSSRSGHDMVAAIEAEAATYGVERIFDHGKGRYYANCSNCPRRIGPFYDPSIMLGVGLHPRLQRIEPFQRLDVVLGGGRGALE
jgi:hypothetical protein